MIITSYYYNTIHRDQHEIRVASTVGVVSNLVRNITVDETMHYLRPVEIRNQFLKQWVP